MEMGGIFFSKIWSYNPPTIRFGRVQLGICLPNASDSNNNYNSIANRSTFKRQPHKIVTHTQTIRQLLKISLKKMSSYCQSMIKFSRNKKVLVQNIFKQV